MVLNNLVNRLKRPKVTLSALLAGIGLLSYWLSRDHVYVTRYSYPIGNSSRHFEYEVEVRPAERAYKLVRMLSHEIAQPAIRMTDYNGDGLFDAAEMRIYSADGDIPSPPSSCGMSEPIDEIDLNDPNRRDMFRRCVERFKRLDGNSVRTFSNAHFSTEAIDWIE